MNKKKRLKRESKADSRPHNSTESTEIQLAPNDLARVRGLLGPHDQSVCLCPDCIADWLKGQGAA